MIWFFKNILSFVTGGGLNGIASELRQAHADKIAAETDETRIAADVTIQQLEARQAVLIKGGRFTPIVQALWAAPFVIYNAKVIVWDKVLVLGVTDPLGEYERNVGMLILSFYFLTTGAVHVVNRIRN